MSQDESDRKDQHGYLRIVLELVLTTVGLAVIGGVLSFEHASLGITEFYAEVARLILLVVGVITVLALIQGPLRNTMQRRGGPHFASAFVFFTTTITLIIAFLAFLAVLSIPATSFLVAVGGIGIVVGFAISTVTTNIISGAFMLTSFPIKIGQRIIITVNNQPGTITGISTLFMTVTTDAGAKLIIPNAAIFQGMAFMLDVGQQSGGRVDPEALLAKPGDRVISTLYPYPATVTEVTRLTTRIVTDGGQVLTIPNQAILNGGNALVKIHPPAGTNPALPVAVGDEVRLSAGNFEGKVTEIGPYYFRVASDDEEVWVPLASLTGGAISAFKKRSGSGREHQQGNVLPRPEKADGSSAKTSDSSQ